MAATSSVSVALRIKPVAPGCTTEYGCLDVAESGDGQRALVTVRGKGGTLSEFAFDTVFMDSPAAADLKQRPSGAVLPNTQRDVFKRVARPLCRAVLKGMHASILAYGQTGSGKTYTVLGPLDTDRQRDPEHHGLLPRCLRYLFRRLPQQASTSSSEEEHTAQVNYESQQDEDDDEDEEDQCVDGGKILGWKMEVQFVEIYQERLFDLLGLPTQQQSSLQLQTLATGGLAAGNNSINNSGSGGAGLAVRYDKHGKGAHVAGAVRKEVLCLEDALEAFRVGLRARRTSETKLNTSSSRSHAIFSVFLTQTKTEPMLDGDTKSVVTAQLHLVDLAGSERQKDTQAVGERLREAGKINSSLSILSQVVRELAEGGGNGGHVPYRDSKLTFLLMNSLGGTGKAAVIATLNQHQQHAAETRSTLTFAALSKSVRLRPVTNQTLTLSHERVMALMRERAEMAAELKRLKALVSSDGVEHREEETKPAVATAADASADLFQALIDATETAEFAKAQLRAILRSEREHALGQPATEGRAVLRPGRTLASLKEEEPQDYHQQTQRDLLQLLLRHCMYSPQLLLQLQESGLQTEAGGVEAFLRLQALLVRLLEMQQQPEQNASRPVAMPSTSQMPPPPASAAVSAALASALGKAVPLLKANAPLLKDQQDRPQQPSLGQAFPQEAPARKPDESTSNSDASSTIMETAPGEDARELNASQIEEPGDRPVPWEPQILATAQLLESLADAAFVDSITREEKLEAARAAEARRVCANKIDEAMRRLAALRGFNDLSKKEGGGEEEALLASQGTGSSGDFSLVELGPGEAPQVGLQCALDSRLSTLASRGISSSEALEEASFFPQCTANGPGAQTQASSSDEKPARSVRQPNASSDSAGRPAECTADAVMSIEEVKDIAHQEERSSNSTLGRDPDYKDLHEMLESERNRSRKLERRIAELERQVQSFSAFSEANDSPNLQEKFEGKQLMRLPLALPLSAVCDGNRVIKGQLVFCIHAEAGEPSAPRDPSYRGPCYVSIWEEREGEHGRPAAAIVDSVSFALIKKVSRVLESEKVNRNTPAALAGQASKLDDGNGPFCSEEDLCSSQDTDSARQSRFIYRLYFRRPVAIALEPESNNKVDGPTLISWITIAMDEAALTRWHVSSPEECDRLVLHAMRRGAGKQQCRLVSSQLGRMYFCQHDPDAFCIHTTAFMH